METLINRSRIFTQVAADSKQAVIEKLSSIAYRLNITTDAGIYLQDILQREKQFSTNLGQGIAIPHCRSESVLCPSIIVLKMKQPIVWDGDDGEPVRLVINFAVPDKSEPSVHLKLLSQIARKLSCDDFITRLMQCETADQIFCTFTSQ